MERVSINTLVDCGTASGDDPVLPFAQFPVPPDKIDYLLLTHAHIDHIGRVPELIEAGFRGEIICPHATKAMLLPMLRDANARDFRVIFSGDLGYTGTPILSDPDPPESCGLLILEPLQLLDCEMRIHPVGAETFTQFAFGRNTRVLAEPAPGNIIQQVVIYFFLGDIHN